MNIIKINKWLKEHNFYSRVKSSDYFCYNTIDDLIYVSKEIPDHINDYKYYCNSLGLSKNVNDRTLCFLHELGHSETIWDINDYVCLFDRFISRIIDKPSRSKFNRRLKCNLYYRLPTERAATKWAIDFINNNDYLSLEDIL